VGDELDAWDAMMCKSILFLLVLLTMSWDMHGADDVTMGWTWFGFASGVCFYVDDGSLSRINDLLKSYAIIASLLCD